MVCNKFESKLVVDNRNPGAVHVYERVFLGFNYGINRDDKIHFLLSLFDLSLRYALPFKFLFHLELFLLFYYNHNTIVIVIMIMMIIYLYFTKTKTRKKIV